MSGTELKVAHPIFEFCCASQRGPHGIDAPFILDGRWFATDGQIAVRSSEKRDWADSPEPFTPVRDLAWGSELVGPVYRMSRDPAMEHCDWCDGTGFRQYSVCRWCEGKGTVNCLHCDSDTECRACLGKGTVEGRDHTVRCVGCGRLGIREPLNSCVKVGDRYIKPRHAYLFWKHSATLQLMGPAGGRMFRFFGDGFDGMVMAINYTEGAYTVVGEAEAVDS